MKYIIFLNGKAQACYSPAVHSTIPPEAVEVSDADWKELIENQDTKKWNGTIVIPDPDYVPPEAPGPAPITPEEIFTILLKKNLVTPADRPER